MNRPLLPFTEAEVLGWIVLLLVLSVFGLGVYHAYNPKNRITRGIAAFWNTPAIVGFRKFLVGLFKLLFFGFIAVAVIWWYFNESNYYPRHREVAVFFKAHQWIEGEIQSCYSEKAATVETPDAEVTAITCSEDNEFHVLKVTFWGPIKADRKKVWKCERSSTTMTCELQWP